MILPPEGYDVSVEQAGLEWEPVGPLFERYKVGLAGVIDRRWVACYMRIAGDATAYTRFRLDPATSSVSFTCRKTDGPAQVMAVLGKLEELVALVNREATEEAQIADATGPLHRHASPLATSASRRAAGSGGSH
jgi:hypothetical protein